MLFDGLEITITVKPVSRDGLYVPKNEKPKVRDYVKELEDLIKRAWDNQGF